MKVGVKRMRKKKKDEIFQRRDLKEREDLKDRRRWEGTKINVNKLVGCGPYQSPDRDKWRGCCEHGDEPSVFVKCWEFLDFVRTTPHRLS